MTADAPLRTRERIQQVALELFATQGFERTSLRHIADRLGFTKAALYYHFPSKAELVRSLVEPMVADTDRLVDDLTANRPDSTEEILGRWFDVFDHHRAIFVALMVDASGLAQMDDLPGWAMAMVERMQEVLVGPQASMADRVRVIVALGGLGRAVVFVSTDSRAEVRAVAVAAAHAALRSTVAPENLRSRGGAPGR